MWKGGLESSSEDKERISNALFPLSPPTIVPRGILSLCYFFLFSLWPVEDLFHTLRTQMHRHTFPFLTLCELMHRRAHALKPTPRHLRLSCWTLL